MDIILFIINILMLPCHTNDAYYSLSLAYFQYLAFNYPNRDSHFILNHKRRDNKVIEPLNQDI
jgi:hypothetical protein